MKYNKINQTAFTKGYNLFDYKHKFHDHNLNYNNLFTFLKAPASGDKKWNLETDFTLLNSLTTQLSKAKASAPCS